MNYQRIDWLNANVTAIHNNIVQGQHPANLSHCIFAQIEVMIILPRRKIVVNISTGEEM